MRCKCCNNKLNYGELQSTQEDGTPESMCSNCRAEAFDDSYEHVFLFEDLQEGVTKSKNFDY